MANEKNLEKGKATQFKKGDAAKESGKKGGVASGEARRERKTLKDELLLLLAEGDTQKKMCTKLINRVKNKGDVKAFIAIRDTIGEKPMEKIITANIDPETAREVEEMVRASLPELQKMVHGERTEQKEEAET